jgi:hypothetical protein
MTGGPPARGKLPNPLRGRCLQPKGATKCLPRLGSIGRGQTIPALAFDAAVGPGQCERRRTRPAYLVGLLPKPPSRDVRRNGDRSDNGGRGVRRLVTVRYQRLRAPRLGGGPGGDHVVSVIGNLNLASAPPRAPRSGGVFSAATKRRQTRAGVVHDAGQLIQQRLCLLALVMPESGTGQTSC